MNLISLQPLFSKNPNAPSKAQPRKQCPLAGKVAVLSKKFEYVSQAINSSLHHKVYPKITLKNVGKVLGLSLLVLGLSRGFRDSNEKPVKEGANPIDIKKLALFHMQKMAPICNPNYTDLNSCQTNLFQNRFTVVCPDSKDSLEFRAHIDFDKINTYIPGQLKCPNGFSYDGNFHIDRLSLTYKINGHGKVIEPGGNQYTGFLNAGIYEGQGGIKFPTGDSYLGEFKAGKLIKGTKHFPNGYKYEGKFDNYLFEGVGKLTLTYKACVYVGTFNEGKYSKDRFDGEGTWTCANGEVYVGNFKEGLPHGKGTFSASWGTQYEGDWKDGLYDGQGILTHSYEDKCVGAFKKGKYHGFGKIIYISGNIYEGDFKEGKIDGKGTYTWSNRNEYKGDWKNGQMHGQGVLTYPDGKKYEGEWQEDLMHGLIKITHRDGSIETKNYTEGLSSKL